MTRRHNNTAKEVLDIADVQLNRFLFRKLSFTIQQREKIANAKNTWKTQFLGNMDLGKCLKY